MLDKHKRSQTIQTKLDDASRLVREAMLLADEWDKRQSMKFRAFGAKTQAALTELGEERRIMFGESSVSTDARACAENARRRNAETPPPVVCIACQQVITSKKQAMTDCPKFNPSGGDETGTHAITAKEWARLPQKADPIPEPARRAGYDRAPARKRARHPLTDPAARTAHERDQTILPESAPSRVSISDELGDEFHKRKTSR